MTTKTARDYYKQLDRNERLYLAKIKRWLKKRHPITNTNPKKGGK